MTYEQIRNELEKNYSHVTFIITKKVIGCSMWYVNDNMEKIYIPFNTDVDKLKKTIADFETEKVISEMKSGTVITKRIKEKLTAFKMAILSDAIKPDRKLYKKFTAKQFEEMVVTK